MDGDSESGAAYRSGTAGGESPEGVAAAATDVAEVSDDALASI